MSKAGKVEIEWLEPLEWVGKRQLYPRRQIYGTIKPGNYVRVSYAGRKWKAKVIGNCDIEEERMAGKPPSTVAAAKDDQEQLPCTLKEHLRVDLERDKKNIEKLEEKAAKLDQSFEETSEGDNSMDVSNESSEDEDLGAYYKSTHVPAGQVDVPETKEEKDVPGTSFQEGSRWRKRNEKGWKKNVRKRKRLSGEAYKGCKGQDFPAKFPKPFPTECCKRKRCSTKFTDERRQTIFNHYYSLNGYERMMDFILANVVVNRPERDRRRKIENIKVDKKSRNNAITYFLNTTGEDEREDGEQGQEEGSEEDARKWIREWMDQEVRDGNGREEEDGRDRDREEEDGRDRDGEEDDGTAKKSEVGRIEVCREFFKGTLAISEKTILSAIRNRSSSGHFVKKERITEPSNKMSEEEKQRIKSHIESFPTMESHYCRKDSKRKYFTADLTIQKLYDLYVKKCKEDGVEPRGKTTYGTVFGLEYNIGRSDGAL